MGGRLLICDRESSYALHLMEYLYKNWDLPCEISVCTDPGTMRETAPSEEAVLTILSESFLREAGGVPGTGAVLVLTEDGGTVPGLPDTVLAGRISKYSPAARILARARELYLQAGPSLPGRMRAAAPLRIIGVYSPVGGCLRTALALAAGKLLAAESAETPHRVLYMNLEPLSGLQERLGVEMGGSLSDLLYYNACAPEKLAARLQLLRATQDGLDLLPPMHSWLALRDIRGEAWLQFLEAIGTVTDYSCLLLDLTEHPDGLIGILRRCDEILMPVREDPAAAAKVRQLEEVLREQDAGDVWGRIRRISLPPAITAEPTEGGLTEWLREFFRREDLCRK